MYTSFEYYYFVITELCPMILITAGQIIRKSQFYKSFSNLAQ
ncbi:hypothetical protein X975_13153, partial [Stegodyphus mimosarum]